MDEVKKHNKEEDGWMVYNNKVYNVTKFIPKHLRQPLVRSCGGHTHFIRQPRKHSLRHVYNRETHRNEHSHQRCEQIANVAIPKVYLIERCSEDPPQHMQPYFTCVTGIQHTQPCEEHETSGDRMRKC